MLRYAVGLCIVAAAFPWTTLAVNVGGSLAIGLCGGFTTFSTFSKESLALVQSGRWGTFALYAIVSFSLGLFAVMAGFLLARH